MNETTSDSESGSDPAASTGRLIAIGDIHGRDDKLEALLDQLQPDADDELVFLGDYIDRGPDSFGVVERLIRRTALQRDSGELAAALPRQLSLRMAAWLRGTQPRPLLKRLRFGLTRSRKVQQLLEHHPRSGLGHGRRSAADVGRKGGSSAAAHGGAHRRGHADR